MTRMIMLLAFLSSAALPVSGCAHDDSPAVRMLETRADYDAEGPEAQTLALASAAVPDGGGSVPVRLPPKVANIWVHAHETPEHEYFWGAWLSVVVAGEEWSVPVPPAPAGKGQRGKGQLDPKKTKKPALGGS